MHKLGYRWFAARRAGGDRFVMLERPATVVDATGDDMRAAAEAVRAMIHGIPTRRNCMVVALVVGTQCLLMGGSGCVVRMR